MNTDPVVGAMGLDFKMDAFYVFLTDAFPACLDPSNVGYVMQLIRIAIIYHVYLPIGAL